MQRAEGPGLAETTADATRRPGLFPPLTWLRGYRPAWLTADLVAGITLAAYAIPVALAYATLAGLPPQVGVYGYMLGGLGYALLGSSRHLAVGPTSAISLMVGANVAAMAGGDMARAAEIATLAGFAVALLCLVGWALRLSALVKLISDSVLVGFKAGAGITIALTQLPSLFGVPGGGHTVITRVIALAGQLGSVSALTLALGVAALVLLVAGARLLPGRPVGLAVVALSILVVALFGLAAHGVAVTGTIPSGLPALGLPGIRLVDVEGIFPLAAGCLLLAYIEGVSAARSFAEKHGYALDPRQEFLGIGAANLFAAFGHGYPVAGGLSQSAVSEQAGAKTPIALVVASATLALSLLFLTGLLANLPKAALAAIVLTAVAGLIDITALRRLWRVSKSDFAAAIVALVGVLLLGILQGILLAALASILMLLAYSSRPHVAFLARMPGSSTFGDIARHPENEPIPGMVAFRPEASLLYTNAEVVRDAVLAHIDAAPVGGTRLVVCDLSASPMMDMAGAGMLRKLHEVLARRDIRFAIVEARGRVRDLLRREGLADQMGGIDRGMTLQAIAAEHAGAPPPG
ncbi:SulP family inorganic anion transporter [Elioraea sp.]|uniref:SulP family inorganic anion transporter n=1 Tax=Elioraea sp. TaxID=2185103 RepID=UPI0025BF5011|nr:SulP family inorganic anion transporter [Elioraea sp.]